MFLTFFLHLFGCGDHIGHASLFPRSTLGLMEQPLFRVTNGSVQRYSSGYIDYNAEQRCSYVIVTDLKISFFMEKNGGRFFFFFFGVEECAAGPASHGGARSVS